MRKMFTSFVVAGILTVGNISAVASEYIKNTVDIVTQIDTKSKIKNNDYTQIGEYLDLLEKSDKEFQEKVVTFMFDNYKELDSSKIGFELASIALAVKGKNIRYEQLINIFKKDKHLITYNKKLLELKANNNKIKTQIQEVIDLVFLHIEAKGYYKLAKEILNTMPSNNIVLKDYWYIKETNDENKALFISIEENDDIDLDSIYTFEDEMNKNILDAIEIKKNTFKRIKSIDVKQTGGYNFEAMKKTFFKRVSIV
mgnify:FL=1